MREAEIKRKTKETEILVRVNLDEKKFSNINIPEGFFLHMLETLARHVNFGIEIKGKGDIQIDWHHLGEDTGIVFSMFLFGGLAMVLAAKLDKPKTEEV